MAQLCVTDLTCTSGQSLLPNTSVSGCCPTCGTSVTAPPILGIGCQEPYSCLDDDRYAPVQCKGDVFTGRCFCYDEDGNRLFGQMWRDEATDMTCGCSRRRAELEAAGRKTVTLHCTPSGDYEPLQCDDGMCWCAQPKTGQPTVPPLPVENMKFLPCYDATLYGENYLRRCESIVHSLAMISQEQSDHGTNFLGNPVTFCDYDGSFGSYQIDSGQAVCTGPDGERLGSWASVLSTMAGMNCNCARDTSLYFPERGMMVTEQCMGNGNYEKEQIVGDITYCVDNDGYETDCNTVEIKRSIQTLTH